MRAFLPKHPSFSANWSVRTWLNLLVLACLLPGVIGAALLFLHQYQVGRAQQIKDVLQTARALTHAVDNELLRTKTAAQALASDPILAQRDLARFHERARTFLSNAELGTNVVLTDASSQLLLNTAVPYGKPLPSMAATDAGARLRRVFATGEPAMTDVFLGPVLRQHIMALSQPVAIDGKTAYVLSIGILTERFNRLLRSQAIPPAWIVAVMNSEGTIVGRSRDAERFVGTSMSPALRQAMARDREGVMEAVTREGTAVLMMHSRSDVAGWSVAIGIPRATLAAGLQRAVALAAAVLAVIFCIGLVLARLVSRRIAASFEVLTAPAAALGQGGEGEWLPVAPVHVKEARDVAHAIGRAGRLLQERADLLRSKETELAEAHRLARFGSWHLDRHTGKARASDTLKEIFGRDVPSLADMRGTLLPVASWEQLHAALQETIDSGEERELEAEARDAGGHPLWLNFKSLAIRGRNGEVSGVLGTVLDITKRRQAEERLRASEEQMRKAALHDPLTGLPNRMLVFEYGERVLAAAKRKHIRGALLFIDLDRFKPINDLYGHDTGDRLLQQVGRRLLECTRQEDLVGRLGGDEFVIILPHLEPGHHQADTVARHVLDSIGRPFRIGALELSVSPSIGISCFPAHATDMSALLHAADLAMYHAKRLGRARYQHYIDEFDQQAGEVLRVESRLKMALRDGGLRLHYQPVIDIGTGLPIGAEALLRLEDDDELKIGPDRFIPIAEAAGLIGLLGEWVAREACRQHQAWRAEGLDVCIAINVSPLQFRQPAFAEQLSQILLDTGMDPAALEVEVTESTVMEDLGAAVKILDRIKLLGVKVALDDFGTGYSSLSSLSTLPLDKLKVDQSFVRRLEQDPASRAVTGTILTLGRNLQLEVQGEGIESALALQYLQDHGCHKAQGYWFSRPLPPAEFAQWFSAYRDRQQAAPAS